MKKLLYISIICLAAFSCNIVDVEPQNSISAENAFKTKEDIDKGILGAYASLQSLSYYGRTYSIFADLAADNLSHPVDATASDYAEVDNNNMLPENGSNSNMWAIMYDGINVANNVISKVPIIPDMTEEERNAALAELYFIRALNHFNLTRYYGAIPIKLEPTVGVNGLDAPRVPVNEVYAQIITDLNFAAENLPNSRIKIRGSKFAAKALLARVYLYQGNYQQAATMASDVLNNGGYTLLSNYADVFADEENAESIFEISFSQLERNRIAEYNFPKSLNGRREVEPTQDLLDAYEAGDTRFAASVAFADNLAYAIKYDDLNLGADNFIVIRLADMYLIRAEALAKGSAPDANQIKADLNTVRTRAGLSGITSNSIDQLISAIEKERRVEFAFEGHRWFDLVRTGRAIDVLVNVTSINQTLFPIPFDELQTNKDPGMFQNPGY
ncbi:MAG: RagB/SusD family nutrient uptake outer membrane protein [Flavobacteriaceae bacterium]|nr:RagB/SusD family nutrient uptake outer membrane protein [Flavobacteriaceae bacterium]